MSGQQPKPMLPASADSHSGGAGTKPGREQQGRRQVQAFTACNGAPHVPAARSSVHPPVSPAWLDPGTSQLAWPANAHTHAHTYMRTHTHTHTHNLINQPCFKWNWTFIFIQASANTLHIVFCVMSRHAMDIVLCCVSVCCVDKDQTVCCVISYYIMNIVLCCVMSISAMLTRTRWFAVSCHSLLWTGGLLCHVIAYHGIVLYYVSVCHVNKGQAVCCVMLWHTVNAVMSNTRKKPLTYGRRSVAAMLTRTSR